MYKCRECGNELELIYKNSPHTIVNKEVMVINAPTLKCTIPTCGRERYLDPKRVDILIRNAYLENITTVEYK